MCYTSSAAATTTTVAAPNTPPRAVHTPALGDNKSGRSCACGNNGCDAGAGQATTLCTVSTAAGADAVCSPLGATTRSLQACPPSPSSTTAAVASTSHATASKARMMSALPCGCADARHGVTHLAVIMDGNRRYGKRQASDAVLTSSHAGVLLRLCQDICEGEAAGTHGTPASPACAVTGDAATGATATKVRCAPQGWLASRYTHFLHLIERTPLDGHRCGAEQLMRVITHCIALDIPMLTVYAFSTDNWRRSALEVNVLMTLFMCFFDRIRPAMHEQGIFIRFISTAPQRLPPRVLALMRVVETESRGIVPRNITVNVCVSYSGMEEIANACDRVAAARVAAGAAAAAAAVCAARPPHNVKACCAQEGTVEELRRHMLRSITQDEHEAMDANVFSDCVPREPQLLVRTSGERRISNFLLYESAYTELHFTAKTWPELTRDDLLAALHNYGQRERRFGR